MKYLLDTHTWIWWYLRPESLSKKVVDLICDPSKYDELLLSAISPWEFCKLIEKKRLFIKGNPQKWLEQAFDLTKLRLVHLTPVISYESTVLKQPFHNDPADQIIVATANIEQAAIITKDQLLADYKHVKTFW